MTMDKKGNNKRGFFGLPGVRSFLAALICILLGLLVGYIVLLIINPENAGKGMEVMLKNFLARNNKVFQLKHLGNTVVKTAPLILCSLSILFAYKTGMFNIGAAGQYVAGAGACLYFAYKFSSPWYICILVAIVAGALWGAISGALKAYLNVNEVISGIMLNWISLYIVNMLMKAFCKGAEKDTIAFVRGQSPSLIPNMGLDGLFSKNTSVTIAIPLTLIIAVAIWILLSKTKFGYEIKATGFNKNAAKYAGMREKSNIILTMVICGALAGIAASFFFLSGFSTWNTNQTSVPAMGFNGIAAAFLGGLHPIGVIFSSYFIQHISDGGTSLTGMYPAQIADLVSAIIIYLCGFVLFMKLQMSKVSAAGERRRQAKLDALAAAEKENAAADDASEEMKGGEAK